jgi:LysM repeat protein
MKRTAFILTLSIALACFAENDVTIYPQVDSSITIDSESQSSKPEPRPNLSSKHQVKPGDTLWKLSRQYHVSVESLKKANSLQSDSIRDGEFLTIPTEIPTSEVKPVEKIPQHQEPETLEIRKAIPVEPPPKSVSRSEMLRQKFIAETRQLATNRVSYNEDWTPPGEQDSWVMDCSNTTRYLYKKVAGIQIDRTASDQYFSLHQKDKAWMVPLSNDGKPDVNFLKQNLRPGDLLFWENTYKPKREPPITHVMIFLGSNSKGQWIMAGSQESGGGETPRRGGGPDIYQFDPQKTVGGYSTWLGLFHRDGKFVAFGRPL